jgi:hypothetical protein
MPGFRVAMMEWQQAHAAHLAARKRLAAARHNPHVRGQDLERLEFALSRSRVDLNLALERLTRAVRNADSKS